MLTIKLKEITFFLLFILLCTIAISFSSLANAEDKITWLNRWDRSCYEQEANVNSCRQDWYKTTQGSHLLPWEVFNTIEEADSETLFSARNSLSKYGFLYPEERAYDAANTQYNGSYGERVERDISVEGMPIGFLRDKSEIRWSSECRR